MKQPTQKQIKDYVQNCKDTFGIKLETWPDVKDMKMAYLTEGLKEGAVFTITPDVNTANWQMCLNPKTGELQKFKAVIDKSVINN